MTARPHLPLFLPVMFAHATALLVVLTASPSHAGWLPDGVPVCPSSGVQEVPAATTDGVGGAIVVWQDGRSGAGLGLYAMRLDAAGSSAPGWPAAGLAVCAAEGAQPAEQALLPDGAGGAFVAWRDDRSGGASNADIYVQRITATGTIAPGWPADGLCVCAASGIQRAPVLATDGAGGVFVAWADYRAGSYYAEVRLSRVTGSGGLVAGWPVEGLLVATTAMGRTTSNRIGLVSDGGVPGGVIVAWASAANSGNGFDLIAQRFDGAGAELWNAGGVEVCTPVGHQMAPMAVPDGAGGLVVAWQDNRTNPECYPSPCDYDIYAQRITSAGAVAPGWPGVLAGRALCTAANDQTNPVVVADGAGGAFVAWKDPRPGTTPPDIYLQRVAGSGEIAPGWPSAATALGACTAAGTQQSPAMVRDGADGVILAWQDLRSGAGDIYAVRIGGDGSVIAGWTADGTPVCTAGGAQGAPAMVDDAAGGAIVAWSDGRATPSAIYAQRVASDGTVAPSAGVTGGPAAAALDVALRPNPTRGGALVRLALPAPTRVTAEVLDPAGRRVRLLCAGRELPAGETTLAWDGCDRTGARAAAGLYFVRVMAGGTTVTRRLAVTR